MKVRKFIKEDADDRRDIFAAIHTVPQTKRDMVFYVKRQAVLGNHYHKTFQENFLLVQGSATLRTQRVNKAGQPLGRRKQIQIQAPCVITMPTYTAYAFRFSGPGVMVCRITRRIYDEKDINEFFLI